MLIPTWLAIMLFLAVASFYVMMITVTVVAIIRIISLKNTAKLADELLGETIRKLKRDLN